MLISKKAQQISPSQTLAISAKAKEMKAEGHPIIGFTAGEPDFDTPSYIVDAAKFALDQGKTKYTPASGTMELKKAIAKKLEKENGLSYAPTQIIVSNGAKHSLYNALYAIIDDGDEVIIPAPFWLTYSELVKLCGGKPVIVYCSPEENFKISANKLKNAITSKTKAFILNSPSNPCGSIYSKEELSALAEVLDETDIITISDEIYEKLVYGKEVISIATCSEKMKQNTIVINGVSKTYAMTGWRIGYLAANKEIAKAVSCVQSHMTSNPNSIAQEAAVKALKHSGPEIEEMRKIYDTRRNIMYDKIMSINGLKALKPDGAFYIFVNVSGILGKKSGDVILNTSFDVCEALLKYNVACIPGGPFGANDHIRLSFAVSMTDIEQGMKLIEKFVNELK